MRILIVGGGAREHAIAWKLASDSRVEDIACAPGNAGTAAIGRNIPIGAADVPALVSWAAGHRPDLTVVGPEAPLAARIVDEFERIGLRVFGPRAAAARLESSKVWARELMLRYRIPHAGGRAFAGFVGAQRYIEKSPEPLVVKADGLAAGKGVLVAQTREEAIEFARDLMEKDLLGEAGRRIVVEEALEGVEASVMAFTDGRSLAPMVPAQDYKRAYDGDTGPNTGGMGAIAPPPRLEQELLARIEADILQPAIDGLRREGTLFKGVLYAGLMLTAEGPKVLEFNCRFGDPETQVVLPLLESSLLDALMMVAEGRLDPAKIAWSAGHCCGVVLASAGYPGSYAKGMPITGLDDVDPGALVFHAGTKRLPAGAEEGAVVTDGGRVLTVVGCGATLAEAREMAYRNAELIRFEGRFYRKDIGER